MRADSKQGHNNFLVLWSPMHQVLDTAGCAGGLQF